MLVVAMGRPRTIKEKASAITTVPEDVELAPETCQKYFKLDEPVIPASGERRECA